MNVERRAASRVGRSLRRPLVAAALALLVSTTIVGGVLTACSSGSAPSTPSGSTVAGAVGAVWLDGGRILGVMTQGSSSCAPVAADPALAPDGTLQVRLKNPGSTTPCTKDLVWRTTLMTAPAQIDRAEQLHVTVSGSSTGDVVLPGMTDQTPVEEYRPTIGRSTVADTIVLLTWGSSGCPPVVDRVSATADSGVAIRFVTLSSDRACTADMAPRTSIAQLPASAADATTAVLSGDGFDDVRVAIPPAG